MKTTILFALDLKTDEILISESEKGTNKVNLIERIQRNKNELLFDAIVRKKLRCNLRFRLRGQYV